MVHTKDALYIHALARMTYEASARGKHPLPSQTFLSFFRQLLQDPHLHTEDEMNLFDQSFELERTCSALPASRKKGDSAVSNFRFLSSLRISVRIA